ncbi:hypothetical protein Raf01_68310 [Rugosimonospora africana]|uniref:Protein ImuA n=1 Tax=Rugosimonospora africana TaxID=556532 RepID=A0A8J3QYN1_9ACTN|nr:hypothetical protein Raf01_68310 [Rugosimonospora africana]
MAGIVALRRRIGDAARKGPASTGDAGSGTGPAGLSVRPGQETGAGLATLVRDAGLAGLVRPASAQHADETGTAGDRVLPVLPELRHLLPAGGLRRGSTVAVTPGTTSVLLALLAAASGSGSWCAVVGLPTLGPAAAAELGIALDRLALVPHPGPEWPSVVAALLDGVDIVVAAPPGPVVAGVSSRLAARARQRGSVLVPYARWGGADVVLDSSGGSWHGLGQGRGRLLRREMTISARGRGAAARPRGITVWLPDRTGALAPVDPGALGSAPEHTGPSVLEAVS